MYHSSECHACSSWPPKPQSDLWWLPESKDSLVFTLCREPCHNYHMDFIERGGPYSGDPSMNQNRERPNRMETKKQPDLPFPDPCKYDWRGKESSGLKGVRMNFPHFLALRSLNTAVMFLILIQTLICWMAPWYSWPLPCSSGQPRRMLAMQLCIIV